MALNMFMPCAAIQASTELSIIPHGNCERLTLKMTLNQEGWPSSQASVWRMSILKNIN